MTDAVQSSIVIKNVAVCMYGQYRTGDACKEYIKKFYDMPGVNVDFFCSLKEYETSYTRPHYNEKSGIKSLLFEKSGMLKIFSSNSLVLS